MANRQVHFNFSRCKKTARQDSDCDIDITFFSIKLSHQLGTWKTRTTPYWIELSGGDSKSLTRLTHEDAVNAKRSSDSRSRPSEPINLGAIP